MRRLVAPVAMVSLIAAACTVGSASGERVVRVDFQHDEFASYYWRYFPRSISAHPGDTIVFRQEWTGEPHTVTLGTIADRALPRVDALAEKYEDVDESSPPDVIEAAEREFEEALEGLPTFDALEGLASQNAAQPCYLEDETPPTERDEACDRRPQRAFNGRQSYYSSGFIPPEGPTGNTYRVPLSDDIAPGTYRYFCVIHLPWMQGEIVVEPEGTELPSPTEMNAQTREEIEVLAAPLRRAFADAQKGRATLRDERLPLPMAGYHAGDEFTVAIAEFVPRRIETVVGRPVTWTILGPHTISFNVPPYVPIYLVEEDGTVRRNPQVDEPAGGAPAPPPLDYETGPVDVDGGTWDGEGFFSSGLIYGHPSTYTLRFSQGGRYRYACLVHPKMVGTVVVRSRAFPAPPQVLG